MDGQFEVIAGSKGTLPPAPAMIRLIGVRKDFAGPHGPVEVLRGVSLSIDKGDIFGIIGRSGAGKSTLVRCINMLERPTAGWVCVGGQDLTRLKPAPLRQARRRIGMIFQHFNLLSSRTVFDNVALPLEIDGVTGKAQLERRVTPILELVGLADKRAAYPAQLSGGQKQRVGIARALAADPAVLLCDETTSALDPETTQSILTLLADINRTLGLTIVLVTHEMQVIKDLARTVAVLDQGVVIEHGSVFDLFAAPRSEVTRGFLREVANRDLPDVVRQRLHDQPRSDRHAVLRITFSGPAANNPILFELIRDYAAPINILHGSIDYITGKPLGLLTISIGAEGEFITQIISRLNGCGLRGELIGYVAPDDHATA